MLIRKNLEFSPRPSVCPSVRPQRGFSESLHYFLVSRRSRLRPKESRPSVRPYVRPSVRPSGNIFEPVYSIFMKLGS